MILPIFCAFCYSLSMILTILTKEADSAYEQTTHVYIGSILVGLAVYFFFGHYHDESANNPNINYLLREWDFSNGTIASKMLIISIFGTSGILCLMNAYRIGEPSVISPFEYTMIINALVIGYFIFAELPDAWTWAGGLIIITSTSYVARREARLNAMKSSTHENIL